MTLVFKFFIQKTIFHSKNKGGIFQLAFPWFQQGNTNNFDFFLEKKKEAPMTLEETDNVENGGAFSQKYLKK